MPLARCLFDTPIGACGLVWGEAGVARVQLPEATTVDTARRLLSLHPSSVERPAEGAARQVVDAIVASISGERTELGWVALDYAGCTPFQRRVYELSRAIPQGETRTYGQLARALGDAAVARAVGRALGQNPFAIVVPCHRVLAASGMGGFSAGGGVETKLRLLDLEGRVGATLPLLVERRAAPGVS